MTIGDPDLQTGKWGRGHPDPEISRGQSQKKFFRPFWPQFGLQIRGWGRAPRAPTLNPPLYQEEENIMVGIIMPGFLICSGC